jgi:hypothetical protein
MRKAAGIILITVGVLFLCALIYLLVVIDIMFGIRVLLILVPRLVVFSLLCLVVPVAFHITGGIFCLRRKYWRVCLASASYAVFLSVFFLVLVPSGLLFSNFISMGWIIWVMLVAAVIAVIFIVRRKKEWQEISDSVDAKVSYGG